MTYTHQGEPTTGKPETYTVGPYTAKTSVYTINDYDSAADGSGEAFSVSRELGLHRLVDWNVNVEAGGGDYEVRWDNDNESFRVYNLADGTEVAQGTTIDLDIRVTFIGTGSY